MDFAKCILTRTEELYPKKAKEVAKQIIDLANEHTFKIKPAHFSERDAFLITYADSIRKEGEIPLKTLHKFLKRHKKTISGVHILPFYPSSSDKGFAVCDFEKIDPKFGTWDDIEAIAQDFILAADIVINHVSSEHEWFKRFCEGDENYEDFFIAYDEPKDLSDVFRPRAHPLLTPFETANGTKYVWTTFSTDQIDLNYRNPDVLIAMLKTMFRMIEHGVRVIRLDAIAYVWKEEGTDCVNLPQTHTFVKLIRDVLHKAAPHVWILTETVMPLEESKAYFGSGDDETHMAYNFVLPGLIYQAFINGSAKKLCKWADEFSTPPGGTFFNITATHDGISLAGLQGVLDNDEKEELKEATLKQGGKVTMRDTPEGEKPYEMNITYLDAIRTPDAFLASQAIQISMRGVPGIYLHNLIGARNWNEGIELHGSHRAINRQSFKHDELLEALKDEKSEQSKIYTRYTHMLKIRESEPLFSPSVEETIRHCSPDLFIIERENENYHLIIIVNVRNDRVDVPEGSFEEEMRCILTGKKVDFSERVTIESYEVLWLRPCEN